MCFQRQRERIKHLKFNNDFQIFLRNWRSSLGLAGPITFLEQTSENALLITVYEPCT